LKDVTVNDFTEIKENVMRHKGRTSTFSSSPI